MTGKAENEFDDIALPFRLERTGALGRLVRLGPAVDAVLRRHDYPDAVSVVLGEALLLAAMLGAGLKNESRFTLQTQTDGPLNFLVVNFDWPDALRGYATFDAGWFSQNTPESSKGPELSTGNGALFGSGHLAMTIAPGGDMQQYQGIVALDGQSLKDAAHTYFARSEQLPTTIHLAVAKHYGPGRSNDLNAGRDGWHWRAGGLIAQKLTWEGGKLKDPSPPKSGEHPEDETPDWDEDDDWLRTRVLAETVEDHELLDPLLVPENLLFRLFHEETVRAFEPKHMVERCKCSRDRIARVLARFSSDEMTDMEEPDGRVRVTCEFCGRKYAFDQRDEA